MPQSHRADQSQRGSSQSHGQTLPDYHADADIKLMPLALTRDQVDAYQLPNAPGDEKTGVNFTVRAAALSVGREAAAREQPEKTSAVISGRVLRPGGRPIMGAMVRLIPAASTQAPPKIDFTDAEGTYQFILPKEAAGTYRVAAFHQGYLGTVYGQRRASDPGEEITVAAGDTRDRIVMTLSRPGAIAGRLLDENGDPVEGVAVRASQVRWVDGRRRLVEMAPFTQPTDDLGRYRIFSLQPGEYVVEHVRVTSQPALDIPSPALERALGSGEVYGINVVLDPAAYRRTGQVSMAI